eukprot:9225835-Pyramimonas_sp.AAC.1
MLRRALAPMLLLAAIATNDSGHLGAALGGHLGAALGGGRHRRCWAGPEIGKVASGSVGSARGEQLEPP